jgi:hypothetical protein
MDLGQILEQQEYHSKLIAVSGRILPAYHARMEGNTKFRTHPPGLGKSPY